MNLFLQRGADQISIPVPAAGDHGLSARYAVAVFASLRRHCRQVRFPDAGAQYISNSRWSHGENSTQCAVLVGLMISFAVEHFRLFLPESG